MQAKLFELLPQGESGQPQPACRFRLIAFCQRDGLREDFAFGLGEHASMSVLQLSLLRLRQQFTRERREGAASRGSLGIASDEGLANSVGVDGESTRAEQQSARYV